MKRLRIIAALSVLLFAAFWPALIIDASYATCLNTNQAAAIAAAAAPTPEGETATVTTIETCGGDDVSYSVPVTATISFDGETFTSVYATTNSVITFGRPDNTYWDYPRTPSISLYSMDWFVYPQAHPDEHLIINSSDGGFQVDIAARPCCDGSPTPMWAEVTNIVITAAINADGTVAIAYSVTGPTYPGQTRTGVRLNSGDVVTLEQYGVVQVESVPTLAPEAGGTVLTPSPTPTDGATATTSPTPVPSETPTSTSPSPSASETPTSSPSPSPESSTTQSPDPTPTPTPTESSTSQSSFPENSIRGIIDEGGILELIAPLTKVFTSIFFASYGTPTDYQIDPNCHAQSSLERVTEFVLGQRIASIAANNGVFGDPCGGTYKRLAVVAIYGDASSPSPSETPTATATPTPTTEPTSSPEPSPSPTPVVEPSPVQTPQPTPTQTPEPTPEPTPSSEPSATPSPEPTVTAEPSPSPSESATPTPTPTASPTEKPTPQPTQTPKPEPSSSASPEPKPTPTDTSSPAPIVEDKPTTPEEKAAVAEALIAALAPGEVLSASDIKDAGIAFKDLPPDTPVEVRTDESGNPIVITAEVAANIELVTDPGALVGALLSDPGAALAALGSIGADMSPEERAQSTKAVVATVIAAGAAINAVSSASAGQTSSRKAK